MRHAVVFLALAVTTALPSVAIPTYFDHIDVTANGGGGDTSVGGIPIGSIGGIGDGNTGSGGGSSLLTSGHARVLAPARLAAYAKVNGSFTCPALWDQAPGISGGDGLLATLNSTVYRSEPTEGPCTDLLPQNAPVGAYIIAFTVPGTTVTHLCPQFEDHPNKWETIVHEALHAGGFQHTTGSQQQPRPWDIYDTPRRIMAACPC